jgi:hypothetical protein
MSRFSMPPQAVRLVLLTIGIVGSYLVARAILTPQSFGEYGWYRGAALMELASHDQVYAGSKSCAECHSEQQTVVRSNAHKTLSCEGCHGPSQSHVENPDLKPEILNYSHCVRGHEANPSRPKWHKQIVAKSHYTGDACTECHLPHHPTEAPPEPTPEAAPPATPEVH